MALERGSPLTDIPGIGPAKAKSLARLGLYRVGDLLGHFPQRYEDRRQCWPIRQAPLDVPCCVSAMVAETPRLSRVRRGLELGYREFLLYGSLDGPRLDHTVANFQTLQFLADRGAVGYLVGNRSIVTVVKNGSIAFPAGLRGNLSVFCMGADARGVTERGLYYTLEDGVLTSGFPLGVSNHFTGEPAHISVRDGSLLVIWDKAAGFPVTEQ